MVLGMARIILHHPAFLPFVRFGTDRVATVGAASAVASSEGDRSVAVAACLIESLAPALQTLPLGELRTMPAGDLQKRCSGLNADQCTLLHEVLLAGSGGTMPCTELVHRLLYLDVCGRRSRPKLSAWWRLPVTEPLWLSALGVAVGLVIFLSVWTLSLRMLG
jgi:hypothetical protein